MFTFNKRPKSKDKVVKKKINLRLNFFLCFVMSYYFNVNVNVNIDVMLCYAMLCYVVFKVGCSLQVRSRTTFI